MEPIGSGGEANIADRKDKGNMARKAFTWMQRNVNRSTYRRGPCFQQSIEPVVRFIYQGVSNGPYPRVVEHIVQKVRGKIEVSIRWLRQKPNIQSVRRDDERLSWMNRNADSPNTGDRGQNKEAYKCIYMCTYIYIYIMHMPCATKTENDQEKHPS